MTLVISHPTEGLQVIGQADGDVLTGGATQDWLIGHTGRDVFDFSRGAGADTIIGFEHGVDTIQIHGSIRQTSLKVTDQGTEVFFGAFGQTGPDHVLVAGVTGLTLADFAFV